MREDFPRTERRREVVASVRFAKEDQGARLMAVYTAQLIREGITFEIAETPDRWEVELTNGH
jgi:hypothetical protein